MREPRYILSVPINDTSLLSVRSENAFYYQGPLLLTWINFNPSMDK